MKIRVEVNDEKFEIETSLPNPNELEEWKVEVFSISDTGQKTWVIEEDLLESESDAAACGLGRLISILNGENAHCKMCGGSVLGENHYCDDCYLEYRSTIGSYP